jgi:hypothetical protein
VRAVAEPNGNPLFCYVSGAGFDLTGCLARSSSLLRSTTQSFEPAVFPETTKEPAIGGLLRLRFGLRGDRFWPEGDFGQSVSGPRNPVSPMQIDLG